MPNESKFESRELTQELSDAYRALWHGVCQVRQGGEEVQAEQKEEGRSAAEKIAHLYEGASLDEAFANAQKWCRIVGQAGRGVPLQREVNEGKLYAAVLEALLRLRTAAPDTAPLAKDISEQIGTAREGFKNNQ